MKDLFTLVAVIVTVLVLYIWAIICWIFGGCRSWPFPLRLGW